MATKLFLTLNDCTTAQLNQIIDRAQEVKNSNQRNQPDLEHRVLALLFSKSSTRTRVGFEVAMAHCNGSTIFLSPKDIQLGRGEPLEDTARVLSSMVDIIAIRSYQHKELEYFAQFSSVPVINALSNDYHPCQLLADVLTYNELRGDIKHRKVAWVGDGNNVCQSYINAAVKFNFYLTIACPPGYLPNQKLLQENQPWVRCVNTADEAITGSDLVVTDVWTSMGQEASSAIRKQDLAEYQITPQRMDLAAPDALFMHCLPAHRGEEISEDMLEDPRSVVWQEAENRMHTQKALIEFLLSN